MADAIVSGHGNSVTFTIADTGDKLAVADDVGKPNINLGAVGQEDPNSQDNLSATNAITVRGILDGSSAYSDAKKLAEDIIKPRPTTNNPITLDVSDLPSYSGTIDVVPNNASSLILTYVPGVGELVGVELTMAKINSVSSGSQTAQSSTSPESGSGIKLERNGTSVSFSANGTVKRRVGRPPMQKKEGLLPTVTELPEYFDMNSPASDIFEIQATLVGSSPASDADTLRNTIIRPLLGQDTLTLHFLSNLYGLDAYPVVPEGSQAIRTIFSTGKKDINEIPAMNLRVVDNVS